MNRIGDDNAGFSVSIDSATNTVNVRAWGFWTVDVATSFGKTVRDACRNRPSSAALAIDMSELKPMRDEGQQSFSMLMGALSMLGIVRTTIVTASQLTKLQLLRLATQAGAKDLIQFTEAEKVLGLRTA